jgi:hypothetical protein
MLGTIGLTHPCQIGDSTLLREGYSGTWWRLDQIVTIPICTSRLPVLRKERRQSGFAKLGSALSCRLVDPDRSVGGLQEQSLDLRATIGFESWDRCFYSFFFHFCFGACPGFKVTRSSRAISSMSQTHWQYSNKITPTPPSGIGPRQQSKAIENSCSSAHAVDRAAAKNKLRPRRGPLLPL